MKEREDGTQAMSYGPRDVLCPNCGSKPGTPCTQPTNETRKPVNWYHSARKDRAESATYGWTS